MKKSFFGYQAKEVDEAIDALTKQNTSLIQRNDHLEDELKNMHVQLEEMKANVAHSMTQAQFDEYKELKAAYAALQSRMQDEVDDSERVQELEAKLQAARQEAEEAKRREEAAMQEAEEAKQREEAAAQEAEDAKCREDAALQEAEDAKRREDAALQEAEDAKFREEAAVQEAEEAKQREETAAQEVSALQSRMEELQNQPLEIPNDTELKDTRRALDGARQEIEGKDAELLRKDAELAKKDAELAEKDAELRGRDEQLAEKDASLRTKDEQLAEKDAELAKLKEQPAFARQRDFGVVEINEMMKRVGNAIYETKTDTYHNMMDAVDEFARQWEESNSQLETILKDFDDEKDKTRQELLDTVQLILHQFDRMALKSKSMHANLQNLTTKRAELREKLELTVEQLRSDPVKKRGDVPVDAGQAQKQLYGSSFEGGQPDEKESVSLQNQDTDMLGSRGYELDAEKRSL